MCLLSPLVEPDTSAMPMTAKMNLEANVEPRLPLQER